MIDDRFSAASFADLGIDTDGSRKLADLLQQEVSKEMRQVIETRFVAIIERLNSMGHDLHLEHEPSIGEISYRDDHEMDGDYHCKLRVAFDYVTSAGFAHVISSEIEQ